SPVGANGRGAVVGLVGGARQRLQRRQVVGLEPEQFVQRLDRHLRRAVAAAAGGGLGGEEGGGLFLILSRQPAEGEEALGGAGVLAPALANHALGPERGGRTLAPAGERAGDVERELVRLRVGDQQRQQPLGGKGVRLGGVARLQVRVARFLQLALGDQRFGVGERARAFEGEQELLVGSGRRRQPARGEAQPQAVAVDLRGREARVVERGHLVAA